VSWAGADIIFIEAPQAIDEIQRIADALDAPLLINMVTQGGKTLSVSTDERERIGCDIIIFASDVQRAAIFGMRRLLQELREKRTGEFFPDTVGFQECEGIINSDYYFQVQERYLRLD